MKITHVTTRVLRTPADNPLVVGLPTPTDTREFVTLELGTDEGLVGVGLTFFGGALTPALKSAVDTLAGLTVGEDPTRVEAIAAKCRRAASHAGPGGNLHAGALRHRHRVLGSQGQGGRPVRVRAARRAPRPRAHVRERRAHAAAPREVPGRGGPAPRQDGLPPDEDAVRERGHRGRVDRARARHARGHRPRRGPHVRHQSALEREPGHRDRAPHRALSALLAGRPRRPRRLPRPGARGRQPHHAHRRRRVPLRHRAVPPHAGGPLHRHRDDRSPARGRHHPVDEDRGHGGGLQPAGGEPPHPGVPRPPHRRHPQRPHRGVHAVDAPALPGDARARGRPDRGAEPKPGFGLEFDAAAIKRYQVG